MRGAASTVSRTVLQERVEGELNGDARVEHDDLADTADARKASSGSKSRTHGARARATRTNARC